MYCSCIFSEVWKSHKKKTKSTKVSLKPSKTQFSLVPQVTGSTFTGETVEITSNYVVPELPIKQGSYLDLPVGHDLAVLTLDLSSLGSCSTGYASLSEIEVFVEGTQPKER